MVTNNGFRVVYYTIVPHRPAVRIAAHAREATTVDWYVYILNMVVNLLTQGSLISIHLMHYRLTL